MLKSHMPGVESLILIKDDHAAQRILVAWTMMGHSCKDRPLKKNESLQSVSDGLWDSFGPSLIGLAQQADVPLSRCAEIFPRLIRARLIFPDGTIAKTAQDLLSGQVMAHIRGLIPRGRGNGRA